MEKIKTVELIIDRRPWRPRQSKTPYNKIIEVRIKYGEPELSRKVKALGEHLNPQKKLWELPYQKAVILGLEERIVFPKSCSYEKPLLREAKAKLSPLRNLKSFWMEKVLQKSCSI